MIFWAVTDLRQPCTLVFPGLLGSLRQSKKVGIVKAASRVLVKEVRGIRARITEPMAGWISCVSGNVQVVTRHETDEHIKKVKREVMAHQKTQRDLLTALENVKRKGGIHPKLFGKVRPQNESAEFDGALSKASV